MMRVFWEINFDVECRYSDISGICDERNLAVVGNSSDGAWIFAGALTNLFQQKANLPLDKAKSKTDALLIGETFVIETESIKQAEELVKEAMAIGAVCEIIEDNDWKQFFKSDNFRAACGCDN